MTGSLSGWSRVRGPAHPVCVLAWRSPRLPQTTRTRHGDCRANRSWIRFSGSRNCLSYGRPRTGHVSSMHQRIRAVSWICAPFQSIRLVSRSSRRALADTSRLPDRYRAPRTRSPAGRRCSSCAAEVERPPLQARFYELLRGEQQSDDGCLVLHTVIFTTPAPLLPRLCAISLGAHHAPAQLPAHS